MWLVVDFKVIRIGSPWGSQDIEIELNSIFNGMCKMEVKLSQVDSDTNQCYDGITKTICIGTKKNKENKKQFAIVIIIHSVSIYRYLLIRLKIVVALPSLDYNKVYFV